MQGSSRTSMAHAAQLFEPIAQAAGSQAMELGGELFAVVDALDSSGALRREMTSPNTIPQARVDLARNLLVNADERVRELVATMVLDRWSHEEDLANALERLGIDAILISAEANDALFKVEDELFHFERILVGDRRLRIGLSDTDYPARRRVGLLDRLIEGKVRPESLELTRRGAAALRGRTVPVWLRLVGARIATRRARLVAEVTVAVVMTPAQLERLGRILAAKYDRPVQLNVSVDPQVMGGMRIQVGADVIDATMMSRLRLAARDLS